MKVVYHVGFHDGGYAYHLDDVWSEPFPSHALALDAARHAAERQRSSGSNAHILYQTADGRWRAEDVQGADRPETEVVDDVLPHLPVGHL
ncbi:hypothetical protein [Martelella endophytica]|uniref:DUF2188 domain-containing protein n=1 Tax=Martelella endophytica TaxID=1486262 RepID=A0A0D5LP01_MAREN|nr:hypothetical protein [Martelella endophytica]AJY45851.1 hypothetical protein TM49_09425 [Martelella endophytica]